MLEPREQSFEDRIAQKVAARLLPYFQSGGNNLVGSKGIGSPEPKMARRVLNTKEAAAYIGRSERALYKLVARREIPVVRHGRNLRFDVRELDKWIEGDKT